MEYILSKISTKLLKRLLSLNRESSRACGVNEVNGIMSQESQVKSRESVA